MNSFGKRHHAALSLHFQWLFIGYLGVLYVYRCVYGSYQSLPERTIEHNKLFSVRACVFFPTLSLLFYSLFPSIYIHPFFSLYIYVYVAAVIIIINTDSIIHHHPLPVLSYTWRRNCWTIYYGLWW